MNKILDLFVLVTKEEREVLASRYSTHEEFKKFLNNSMEKILKKECEDIRLGNRFINGSCHTEEFQCSDLG